jgi:hypothetical protein
MSSKGRSGEQRTLLSGGSNKNHKFKLYFTLIVVGGQAQFEENIAADVFEKKEKSFFPAYFQTYDATTLK